MTWRGQNATRTAVQRSEWFKSKGTCISAGEVNRGAKFNGDRTQMVHPQHR